MTKEQAQKLKADNIVYYCSRYPDSSIVNKETFIVQKVNKDLGLELKETTNNHTLYVYPNNIAYKQLTAADIEGKEFYCWWEVMKSYTPEEDEEIL